MKIEIRLKEAHERIRELEQSLCDQSARIEALNDLVEAIREKRKVKGRHLYVVD